MPVFIAFLNTRIS